MDSFKRSLVSLPPVPGYLLPDKGIEAKIKYVMRGRGYKEHVKRAEKLALTYRPPYDGRWQPRPLTILDQFLKGGWRKAKGGWEEYELKESAKEEKFNEDHRGGRIVGIGRRLVYAFFCAIGATISLGFVIFFLLMMGISELGLDKTIERILGQELDLPKIIIGIFTALFILFFLGFFWIIKTKRTTH